MRALLASFLLLLLVASVARSTVRAAPAGSGRAKAPSPAPAEEPIWASGTAVATTADMAAILRDLPPAAAGARATDRFRDLQLFLGADTKTTLHAMRGFKNALGVKCLHCHVENEFEKDTEEKKRTRQMMILTEDLNRTFFRGKVEITCWTCHRGNKEAMRFPPDMKERVAKATPPGFVVPAADAEKPAREVFKNLELLGSVPAGQIPSLMGSFSASLGKDCDFCHLKGDRASDDKKEKRIARSMMRMTMRASAMLEGMHGVVTCWTCHRGDEHAQSVPPGLGRAVSPDR